MPIHALTSHGYLAKPELIPEYGRAMTYYILCGDVYVSI